MSSDGFRANLVSRNSCSGGIRTLSDPLWSVSAFRRVWTRYGLKTPPNSIRRSPKKSQKHFPASRNNLQAFHTLKPQFQGRISTQRETVYIYARAAVSDPESSKVLSPKQTNLNIFVKRWFH